MPLPYSLELLDEAILKLEHAQNDILSDNEKVNILCKHLLIDPRSIFQSSVAHSRSMKLNYYDTKANIIMLYSSLPANQQTVKFASLEGICHSWVKNSTCRYGSKCKYSHAVNPTFDPKEKKNDSKKTDMKNNVKKDTVPGNKTPRQTRNFSNLNFSKESQQLLGLPKGKVKATRLISGRRFDWLPRESPWSRYQTKFYSDI